MHINKSVWYYIRFKSKFNLNKDLAFVIKSLFKGFPGGSVARKSACNAADIGDVGLIPGLGKIPWRREWQSTPVFLPGKIHGQMSLVGYSP